MRRKILWMTLGLFAAFCFLVLLLPTVLGSKWVSQPIIQRLAQNRFILDIDSVRLRWFTPLEFTGITVKQDDQVPLLTIDSIKSSRSLIGYLWNGRDLGKLTINKPTVDVELLSDTSNLKRFIDALHKDRIEDEAKEKSNPKFDLGIDIVDFTAKVQRQNEAAPLVVVPAFDLSLTYKAAEAEPHLIIEPSRVLNEVQLTQELMQLGLTYGVPLLAKSAWFDGKISLETKAIDIWLEQPIKSTGQATLTMHQVRSGPSDPQIQKLLGFVALIRGKEPIQEIVFVDGSQIEVAMIDERVEHRGLQFGLPKIDPRLQISSSGSVGLADRTLAINVELPVPIETIARRDSVKSLGIPSVTLPIAGTLDEPQIDWNVMRGESADLLAMIQGQLTEEAPVIAGAVGALGSVAGGDTDELITAAVDVAKAIAERRRAAKEAQATDPNKPVDPAATEPSPPTNRPIRDAIRGVLRGNQ
jgi:hypothetical protein